MLELRLHIELSIDGPFLSKSSAVGGFGADAVALRDAQGRPLLPGSQVRGRLREALTELAVADGKLADSLADWFGPGVNRDDDMPAWGPRPRGLIVSDFVGAAPADASRPPSLTRIQIDRQTGAVQAGAMLLIEPAASPGETLKLAGAIDFCEPAGEDLVYAIDRVVRGLLWVPAFGSFRSVGFGRLSGVRMTEARLCSWPENGPTTAQEIANKLRELAGEEVPVGTVSAPARRAVAFPAGHESPTRFALTVRIADPFCVGQRRNDRNVVNSASYLSGAVLKGAVAASLLRVHGLPPRADVTQQITDGPWSALARALPQLRFCAAFPAAVDAQQRPLWHRPQSLVKDLQGRCLDVALCRSPFLFQDAEGTHAPAFPLDWKSDDTGGWNSGWCEPDSEFRLHTAIDARYRRARTNHLFALQMIRPEGRVWWGTVDLYGVPAAEREAVWSALAGFLERATLRIGKTKARAQMTLGEPFACPSDLEPCAVPDAPQQRDLWVVTLQSPALLADPRPLAVRASSDPLTAEYRRTWTELSGGHLQLERFFARQSLHGGFLAARTARALDQPYNPLLLTDAGSVFVLRATNSVADARAVVERWLYAGLPLPAWAAKLYGTDYTTNPVLPQDGFGEIAVNLAYPHVLALPEVIHLDQ
jgi:hypothetical protein